MEKCPVCHKYFEEDWRGNKYCPECGQTEQQAIAKVKANAPAPKAIVHTPTEKFMINLTYKMYAEHGFEHHPTVFRNRNHRELTCGPVTVGDMVFVKGIDSSEGYVDTYLICKTVMNGCARFSGYRNGHYIGEYRWNAGDLTQYIASKTMHLCSIGGN